MTPFLYRDEVMREVGAVIAAVDQLVDQPLCLPIPLVGPPSPLTVTQHFVFPHDQALGKFAALHHIDQSRCFKRSGSYLPFCSS